MNFFSYKALNGELYAMLLNAGYTRLKSQAKLINDLNVFPVPDGDTGTNMLLTMQKGLDSMGSSASLEVVASSFAKGAMFGAHGNSGVLLSLYFQGIAEALKGKESATIPELAKAMQNGYQASYRGTNEPVEGTILTVEREGIEETSITMNEQTDLGEFFTALVQTSARSLENTPNLLPVLKEAGVIDSGGKGLLTIFEGMLNAIEGKADSTSEENSSAEKRVSPSLALPTYDEHSVLDYGYCTEFFLQLLSSKTDVSSFSLPDFITWLSQHGNSIVCYQNGTLVKVHIHTHQPGEVINYAQQFGEFVSFKMDNMTIQAHEVKEQKEKKQQKRKPLGILSVTQGDGIRSLFQELGSSLVLDGGPSMDLSTQSFLDAFYEINADTILVLPNDGNIALVANQAAKLEQQSKVILLPSQSMQQGYFALAMTAGLDESALADTMKGEIAKVSSYFVALSSKDTMTSHQGDYVGGEGKQIWVSGKDFVETTLALFAKIPDLESKEAVVIFVGKDVTKEQHEALENALEERYPSLEIGFIPGGQAYYSLWIGVYQ